MYSAILSLKENNETSTDAESQFREDGYFSEPIINRNFVHHHEKESESLLSVLDDKNKMISNLKKQLQNQKMQLTYYIKRELSPKKIRQLSKSCTPQASEYSLPLNLALNKFCKQAGIKTKLLMLHERMNYVYRKIEKSLKDQEFMLRKIIIKLCEFLRVQEMSSADFKEQFGTFITDPWYVNLFDKLLSATLSLRRKLDSFKICCDRVLIIDEERNAIVEEVYSLTVEKRVNLNYLLEIHMEKAQLENELKRILKQQASGKHRIKELNVIEKILHNMQWELNSSYLKNEESCISKMLNKINSEAQVLLEMTKEQKRRFESELSKTRCPEPNRVLLFIHLASGRDNFDCKDFDRYGMKTDEEIRLFEMIKKEIDLLKKKVKEDAEQETTKQRRECEMLKEKITEVMLDNSRTKMGNNYLQDELQQLKLQQKIEMQRLKQERDAYKSQVEDLQAIREAYSQLVDKQPNTSEMERDFLEQITGRDNKILEFEGIVTTQKEDIAILKAKVEDQSNQIRVLSRFINLTRPNSPRNDVTPDNDVLKEPLAIKSLYSSKIRNRPASDGSCQKKSKSTRDKCMVNKSEYTFSRFRRFGIGIKKYNRPTKTDSTPSESFPQKSLFRSSEDIKNVTSSSYESLSQTDQDKLSLSCINFLSNMNSKSSNDIIQTFVSTNEKIISVEIKYKNGDIDDALFELDEYEMFKDVSRESVKLDSRHKILPKSYEVD